MDARILAAINYIGTQLDGKLDLKEIAAVSNLSPFHFHRLFKKETSLTVKKFVESLRIERAFQMMLQPTSRIQEIGQYLGYNDPETFSRAFKRRYKLSPDDLKRILQKAMGQLDVALDPNQCIIIAFKEESPEEITRRIMMTVREGNYDGQVMNEVKAFSVEKNEQQPDASNISQKGRDKYLIKENPAAAALLKEDYEKRYE